MGQRPSQIRGGCRSRRVRKKIFARTLSYWRIIVLLLFGCSFGRKSPCLSARVANGRVAAPDATLGAACRLRSCAWSSSPSPSLISIVITVILFGLIQKVFVSFALSIFGSKKVFVSFRFSSKKVFVSQRSVPHVENGLESRFHSIYFPYFLVEVEWNIPYLYVGRKVRVFVR
jgi:hypothetical protein